MIFITTLVLNSLVGVASDNIMFESGNYIVNHIDVFGVVKEVVGDEDAIIEYFGYEGELFSNKLTDLTRLSSVNCFSSESSKEICINSKVTNEIGAVAEVKLLLKDEVSGKVYAKLNYIPNGEMGFKEINDIKY